MSSIYNETITTTVILGTGNYGSPLTIDGTGLFGSMGIVHPTSVGTNGIDSNVAGNLLRNYGVVQGATGTAFVKGGIGVDFTAVGTVLNGFTIYGGHGGGDLSTFGGTGGAGGDGVDFTGGTLVNEAGSGFIHGGHGGGSAATEFGSGGAGGVGVDLSGGTLTNYASIFGGTAGGAGYGSGNFGTGGAGGAGVLLNGGTLNTYGKIEGGGGGYGKTIGGAFSYGPAGAAVQFGSNASTLIVHSGASFVGAIAGFARGDKIEITNLTPSQVQADFSSNTLTTPADGTLAFTGNFANETFTFTTDAGGTDITLQAACYRRGTRIKTTRGDIPIENLTVGDAVITASHDIAPVRWIGSRSIECSRYARPSGVWPIRIGAGAMAEHQPARDLWVSPGHGIFIEGVLIQAEKLVNGATIRQVPQERIEYWHLELDRHDLLMAEDLPAESYLDTGNRTAFGNGGSFIEAHPDFRPKHWAETCAPLILQGPELRRAREIVLARAEVLGNRIVPDNEVHLVADGRHIEPLRLGDQRLVFMLPAHRQTIELRCHPFVPAHTDPASPDTRALGICVSRLQIDGTLVDLGDESAFALGWHSLEVYPDGRSHRWSHPRTSLPTGTQLIVMDIAHPSRCWSMAEGSDGRCRGKAYC